MNSLLSLAFPGQNPAMIFYGPHCFAALVEVHGTCPACGVDADAWTDGRPHRFVALEKAQLSHNDAAPTAKARLAPDGKKVPRS